MLHHWIVRCITFMIIIVNCSTAKMQISVIPTQAKFPASEAVEVTLRYNNLGDETIFIPKWASPKKTLVDPIFKVTRNNGSVPYVGPLVKRPAISRKDLIALAPGEEQSSVIEISSVYDMNQSGSYVIEVTSDLYSVLSSRTSRERNLRKSVKNIDYETVSATCFVEGRKNLLVELSKQDDEHLLATPRVTYDQCSNSRIAAIDQGHQQAVVYSNGALSYLTNTAPSGTKRYTTWFGTFSKTNWNTIRSHYTQIQNALTQKPVEYSCACTVNNVYAYVYPLRPYKIYLCRYFWLAPIRGTDSKGGTIVHEMSHFDVVVGTRDYAYGQSACQTLAKKNPTNARMNADSHEYFAENTPTLP